MRSIPLSSSLPPSTEYEEDVSDLEQPEVEPAANTVDHESKARHMRVSSLPQDAGQHPRPPVTPHPRKAMSMDVSPYPVVISSGSTSRNASSDAFNDDSVKGYLRNLLEDKVVREYSVADFIYAVWGFHPSVLKDDAPLAGFTLPLGDVIAYMGGTHTKLDKKRSAYGPLERIFNNVLAQITAARGTATGLSFVNMKDKEVKGHFANVRPDFLWSWSAPEKQQMWLIAALFGELKKTNTELVRYTLEVDLGQIPEPDQQNPTSQLPRVSPETPEPATAPSTAIRKRKAEGDLSSRASKRQRCHASDEVGNTAQSASLASLVANVANGAKDRFTNNELQVIKYANELGSHGIRSYATGFLLEDYSMSLWYIDRLGVIKTASFNFFTEPHYLFLFIAAITSASFSRLGFFPLLKWPKSNIHAYAPILMTYKKVTLDLPEAWDTKNINHRDLSFRLEVTEDRLIVPTYDTVGRATIVVPIVANSDEAEAVCGKDGVVIKISWQPRWRDGEDQTIRLIVKRLTSNQSAKKFLANVVDLKCSLALTMDQMESPRAKMFGLPQGPERLCRMLVLKEYLHLRLVKSVDEFKKVFTDVVRGHHAVYTTCRILHRDISHNNIMFYYRDPVARTGVVGVLCDWDLAKEVEEVPSLELAMGDLVKSHISSKNMEKYSNRMLLKAVTQHTVHNPAGLVVDRTAAAVQEPRYRTGTGPFIALDILLYQQVPHHLYRHDLESFFWILVWFVTQFNPETNQIGYIDDWLSDSLWSIGASKMLYIIHHDRVRDKIAESTHPTYNLLYKKWVCKLEDPVFDLYQSYLSYSRFHNRLKRAQVRETERATTPEAEDSAGSRDGIAGLGDEEPEDVEEELEEPESVEDVMREIRALVERREAILTYEIFMKCLGYNP